MQAQLSLRSLRPSFSSWWPSRVPWSIVAKGPCIGLLSLQGTGKGHLAKWKWNEIATEPDQHCLKNMHICFWRLFTNTHIKRNNSRKRPRRVPSKKGLSLKIVIKHRPKFYWSDGCLERLSSNIAQRSTEVTAVCKDCHQTSPKVLLKWWLSLKIVIKHRPKFYWSDGCL